MKKEEIKKAIKALRVLLHQNAVNKGFWPEFDTTPHSIIQNARKRINVGEKIALIHSELSEALEASRKGNPPDHHCPEHDNFTVELADAMIRILDVAEAFGLDFEEAMFAKIEHNASRPYKHGKEF
jgi:NTP pyrophosphatase (non-canonical NTP hydrolase)